MSTGSIILLVILLLAVAAVAALASTAARRPTLRRRVGAEFGRLARNTGSRRARAEFNSRRRRVNALGIKPLSDRRRSGYQQQWTAVQQRFIDSPSQAAAAAGALVTAVAAERGYDVSDSDQLLIDLSVYHGRYLDGYRRATRTTRRATAAATEELRQALLDHRALFQDLLAGPSSSSTAGRESTGDGRRGGWRQIVPPLPRMTTRRHDRQGATAARS